MKMTRFVALICIPLFTSIVPAESAETELSKSDLVGHRMGGREKSWQFRSAEQIKSMVIQNKTDEGSRRIYRVTLELQDPDSPGTFKADALVRGETVGAAFRVESVGLISIVRVN